jgi:hypothetical protein
MRQSYNLEGLGDYGRDDVPETTVVVNPDRRGAVDRGSKAARSWFRGQEQPESTPMDRTEL